MSFVAECACDNLLSEANIMDLEKIEKLNELREKGAITQEEFDAKKKQLLGL